MKLFDAQRQPVILGEIVGRGGEAVVHRIAGRPTILAKIFLPAPRPNYAQKLAWMVDHPPQQTSGPAGHPALAWPQGLLFTAERKMAGYWMPYVADAVPVLDVFNPRRRALTLPRFDRRYLHRAARNLATAVSVVHRYGYIAGDLNENNILVAPSALVTLIDVDSFQVSETRAGRAILHPCPVGKIEYMAPELQGEPLTKIERAPEHDAFALGVLIFQLLMEGNHPFRAQWLDKSDPPPIETRIAQGLFPYAAAPAGPVAPPPNAHQFHHLHPEVAEMIRRTFIDGFRDPAQRPKPRDWERALGRAELALVTCSAGHVYSNHLPGCPICPPTTQSSVKPGRRSSARKERPYRQPVPPRAKAPSAWRVSSPAASPAGSTISGAPAGGQSGSAAPSGNPAARQASPGSPRINNASRWGWNKPFFIPRRPSGPVATQPQTFQAPSLRRAPVWDWARPRVQKSLAVGGGLGALGGLVLAAPLAALSAAPDAMLAWSLLCTAGGLLGGLLRGARPAQRLGSWLGRKVGWGLFWRGAGLAIGGLLGFLVGMIFVWLIIPVFAGAYLGGSLGLKLGEQVWLRGQRFGWERLWAIFSAFGAAMSGALIGFLAARLPGAFIAPLANDLQFWLLAQSITAPLAAGAAGAIAGALGGFSAGLFMDLVNRSLGLLD